MGLFFGCSCGMHGLLRIAFEVFARCSQWTLPHRGAFFADVLCGFGPVCSHGRLVVRIWFE